MWLSYFPRGPSHPHTYIGSRCCHLLYCTTTHIPQLLHKPRFPLTLVMSLSSDPSKKPARIRERKPRGRGLRTRTGCLTCRKRHLKCNEAKPICGPCTRSNHSCIYADPSTPHSDSTSTSTSNSVTKQTSATSSISNSAAPSIATNHGLDYSDPSEGFDLAFRTSWSYRNGLTGGLSQLVLRGHTSTPCYVNGVEYDRIGDMGAHWTPVLEDLDSSRPGTPSLHSEMMSTSAPYGPSYSSVILPVRRPRQRTF